MCYLPPIHCFNLNLTIRKPNKLNIKFITCFFNSVFKYAQTLSVSLIATEGGFPDILDANTAC